jgi:miniconductance mechanosensitive channel
LNAVRYLKDGILELTVAQVGDCPGENIDMLEYVQTLLAKNGLNDTLVFYLSYTITFVAVLLAAVLSYWVVRHFIVAAATGLIDRTRTKWDDRILSEHTLKLFAHLVPAMILYDLTPSALNGLDNTVLVIRAAAQIYMVVILMLVLDSLLSSVEVIYREYRAAREIPIKGFIQVLKIVIYFIALILIISILINKTPLYLLSGIGALAAVLMLIFRDSILGFVAGIQLAANRMVSVGDWIEMPKYGADGDVLEVALTTVKVQNWDKTITTIPTYALISDSFKNWRGMSESGGRRIKRAVSIDMTSIRFCDHEMLQRFAKINYISAYIETKKNELKAFNQEMEVDDSSLVNGRRMTNIGTFRAYVKAYLENHPMINKDMTFLVRQLSPGANGLPIEIYVFSKDKAWANYEAIQADIFDHILAVVPEFDLRVFQDPTGTDFRALKQTD